MFSRYKIEGGEYGRHERKSLCKEAVWRRLGQIEIYLRSVQSVITDTSRGNRYW